MENPIVGKMFHLSRLHETLREEDYDPEVTELLKRYEAGDRNIEVVTMGQEGTVELEPGEQGEKIILTYDLVGCTAPFLYIQGRDHQQVILGHYNPLHEAARVENTLKTFFGAQKTFEDVKRTTAIVITPLLAEQGTQRKAKNDEFLVAVTNVISERLGQPPEIKKYDLGKRHGALVIRITSQNPIQYKLVI